MFINLLQIIFIKMYTVFLLVSKKGLKDDYNSLLESQGFSDVSHKQRNLQ